MNQRTEQSRPKHSAMILGAFCDEFGGVLYKNHELPGESVPAAGGEFWDLGALYRKTTLPGRIQERVSRVKHPENPQKFRHPPDKTIHRGAPSGHPLCPEG